MFIKVKMQKTPKCQMLSRTFQQHKRYQNSMLLLNSFSICCIYCTFYTFPGSVKFHNTIRGKQVSRWTTLPPHG